MRDKIPDHIRARGGKPKWHVAKKAEYWRKLREKLVEEALEFQKAGSIEELADVYEVLEAILAHKGIPYEKILRARLDKCLDNGSFHHRLILDEA